ncbi:MAG: flagellar biosynthesis protein FlhB [Rhodocyclaceae bacterium]|nr:flagellar biosynthesis protein FlhB [Rhodocyclaceae bacterium]
MAEDSDLERTEPASGRRLEQAREEGQVPQSRDLSTFLVLLVGTASLWIFGSWIAQRLVSVMSGGLRFSRTEIYDTGAMGNEMLKLFGDALVGVMPFFVAVILAALAGPMAMGGLIFSGKVFQPDFTRMSPMKGLARMFSLHGVAELVKSVMKVALVGLVAWWVVRHHQDQLFSLFRTGLKPGLASFLDLIFYSTLMIVMGMALVAAVDVPFQLWQYHSKLKMTKEEVRKESKEQEGDPQVKGRIRAMQRQMARKRMMAQVPKADVVVTNPTHYAVALKYDAERMGAPSVVAKGSGHLAARIRELAQEHGVPLLEAPPLARALYRHTEPGDEVPATLYTAVAEVMAYIYNLNQFMAQGGLPPKAPTDITVPAGMDPEVA